jgi:hypothetical protein
MLIGVWIGIVIVVVLGVVLVRRQKNGHALPEWWGRFGKTQAMLPPTARTVFNLQLGDIVQYEGTDWVVEDRLTYDDHGYGWLEYVVQDGDRQRWLSVEEDDRLEVLWLETVTHVEISGTPPQQMVVDHLTYRQTEAGTARMTRLGTTLNQRSQICQYFDYTGPEGTVLSVENWQGDVEVTQGKQIHPRALTLLPGDGKSVYRDYD